jgi:membrane protease subunit HflK
MFNLNDGRWGRGDEPSSNGDRPAGNRPPDADPPGAPTPPPSGNNNNNGNRPRGQGPNQGPPDLDELWRDLNRKLGGFFGGGKGGGNRPNGGNSGGGGNGFQPDMKNAGFGLGLIAGRGWS